MLLLEKLLNSWAFLFMHGWTVDKINVLCLYTVSPYQETCFKATFWFVSLPRSPQCRRWSQTSKGEEVSTQVFQEEEGKEKLQERDCIKCLRFIWDLFMGLDSYLDNVYYYLRSKSCSCYFCCHDVHCITTIKLFSCCCCCCCFPVWAVRVWLCIR